MATPRSLTTVDNTRLLAIALEELTKTQVLVGVPADTTARDDGSAITNAALMYIHENGAPEINLPARPVVYPTVKAEQPAITKHLEAAGRAALAGGDALPIFKRLGLYMQNALRAKITDGPFVPLSPRTVAGRFRKRGAGKRRQGEEDYLDAIAGGASAAEAQAAAGIKPLIDTGALRRSLTYVIRRK